MGWAIALHGGAGEILKTMPAAQREAAEGAMGEFLDAGVAALSDSRPAMEVVELVVKMLEACPLFNAGLGSVLTTKGTVEMEASIMDGTTKRSGAVSGLSTVVHPISLARLVMEKTPHAYIAFAGAEAFAREQGVEIQDPGYFITSQNQERLRKALESGLVLLDHSASSGESVEEGKAQAQFETVGCVAVDMQGRCAAATSTGGLVNKMVGRIGDTPLIGAGTYADEFCAVSTTGKGEAIIRALAAREVSVQMEHKFLSLNEAVETVIWKKLEEGTGGLIAVSTTGELAMSFNTLAMYRAAATEDGFREIGIWEDVFAEDRVTKPESVKSSVLDHVNGVNGHQKLIPVSVSNGHSNGHAKPLVNGHSNPIVEPINGH
ncbi:unnamed protein product [Calypogeia fissa]